MTDAQFCEYTENSLPVCTLQTGEFHGMWKTAQ